MTASELDALQSSGLHRRAAYAITGVSSSLFSVARYYGGCTYHNCRYVYVQLDDELVREDVLRWLTKWRKRASKLPKGAPPDQGVLL